MGVKQKGGAEFGEKQQGGMVGFNVNFCGDVPVPNGNEVFLGFVQGN